MSFAVRPWTSPRQCRSASAWGRATKPRSSDQTPQLNKLKVAWAYIFFIISFRWFFFYLAFLKYCTFAKNNFRGLVGWLFVKRFLTFFSCVFVKLKNKSDIFYNIIMFLCFDIYICMVSLRNPHVTLFHPLRTSNLRRV